MSEYRDVDSKVMNSSAMTELEKPTANMLSKQATNREDFFILNIWDQSDHWLKSAGCGEH